MNKRSAHVCLGALRQRSACDACSMNDVKKMILAEIRDYIKQQQSVTLESLALHFHCQPDAMHGMLEHWIRKGNIRRHTLESCCKGCAGCHLGSRELYEWIA